MSRCKYHGDLPYKVKGCPNCEAQASSSLQPAGSAALVREQDAANELYEAACCLMRYKESDQWHNLENAAHRFNAARQSRLNDEIMRQNGPDQGRRANDSKTI